MSQSQGSGAATNKKAVFFGELLLRLGTKRYERFVQAREFEAAYTGAEANAAVTLANFGMETHVVSVVPQNEIGDACVNFIRQFGVRTDNILRKGHRLGLFYLETGASQRPSKVIYDRGASAITELQPGEIDWDTLFEGKDWFHFSGTAPALGSNVAAVIADACTSAQAKGLTVSCDINYRKKLWSPSQAKKVMTGLMRNVDVLIGNEEDAAEVFGIKASGVDVTAGKLDRRKYEYVAGKLKDTFDLDIVAITLRESISASDNNWSAMLYDGKKHHFSSVHKIHIVDRVGGGDSFTGGLIYGILSGFPIWESLEFATAASCLKHSIHGDLNLVSVAEVRRLMEGDASGRVQR